MVLEKRKNLTNATFKDSFVCLFGQQSTKCNLQENNESIYNWHKNQYEQNTFSFQSVRKVLIFRFWHQLSE